MDDFVLFSDNKETLREYRIRIADFLTQKLKLTLHPNKQQILPVDKGVLWLGYRVYPGKYKRIANRNVVRFRKRLKQLNEKYMKKEITLSEAQQTIAAWFSLSKHAKSFNLSKNIFSADNLHNDISALAKYMLCKRMSVVFPVTEK